MIFLRSLMLILSLVTFTAFAQTVGSTGSSSPTVTCEPGSCGGECPCECDCDDCDCGCSHEACQCDCEDCSCENCDCGDCCNCVNHCEDGCDCQCACDCHQAGGDCDCDCCDCCEGCQHDGSHQHHDGKK